MNGDWGGNERENMIRNGFLGFVCVAVATLSLGGHVKAKEAKQPNILFILVDDLGYGDLSSYGGKDIKTPHIDKLVSSGMRFSNAYANCPVCSPTRASVLTGRFPDLVGVPGVIRTRIKDNWGNLSENAVMLPEVLKKAGYETACIGKWHLGMASPDKPNDRGFDHFHGFLGDMMEDYWHHRRHGINYMRLEEKEIDPKGHATDLFTQWSVEYLKGREKQDKPFFLYLAYNAPHTPINPPKDWHEKVKKREPQAGRRSGLIALIEHMDDGIGRVTAALDDAGLADSTIIIFVSDNGGQLGVGASNGKLRAGKQDMYEGGIRVPACAVWPGKIKPGSSSDRVVLTMDFFPTLCELAAAKVDHEIDGRTILPTLLGKKQPEEDRLNVWVRREGGRYKGGIYYAARRGDWKLVQNAPSLPFELYNLKDDPMEKKNIGKEHKMYKKLHAELNAHIEKASQVPWKREK